MTELSVRSLLKTPTVVVDDMYCQGSCRHRSPEESASALHLVFPYRGVYVRHIGRDDAVADSSQVLFFNPSEAYRISHPVAGGDACLSMIIDDSMLTELAPKPLLREGGNVSFHKQRLGIDARAQALVALLRHGVRQGVTASLEAESLALTLVRRSLGSSTLRRSKASLGRERLVDRIKLVLSGDLSRRWTLAAIAAEVGGSPVYLTQVFQQVEGVPLYRYQLGLRLARALDLLGQYEDLTALSLDLGFSSHSHFSAAFQRTYGRTPSEFRQATLRRWRPLARAATSTPAGG